MNTKTDTVSVFKFLDATLHVRHMKQSPTIQLAHAKALEKVNARYMTKATVKTFTFGAGSKSLSVDNALLGILPKRLLFTILGNAHFSGSTDTNRYPDKHFGLNSFVMYVNGRQVPFEGLSLNTADAKTCTMAHQTLFSGLGIHHGNTGIRIMPTRSTKGSFILIFDLTPNVCASDGHTNLPTRLT